MSPLASVVKQDTPFHCFLPSSPPAGGWQWIAAGQLFEVVSPQSTAQALIVWLCAFRFNNEGCGIARSSVVIVRFIDDGELGFKFAMSEKRGGISGSRFDCLESSKREECDFLILSISFTQNYLLSLDTLTWLFLPSQA